MVVDVLYDGLPLQSGATLREEPGGAFIELEAPMPVGTQLLVRLPDGEKPARVEKVHEGVGSGVLVRFLDGSAASEEHEGEAASAEADGNATASEPEGGAAPVDAGDKKGKKRRGKRR